MPLASSPCAFIAAISLTPYGLFFRISHKTRISVFPPAYSNGGRFSKNRYAAYGNAPNRTNAPAYPPNTAATTMIVSKNAPPNNNPPAVYAAARFFISANACSGTACVLSAANGEQNEIFFLPSAPSYFRKQIFQDTTKNPLERAKTICPVS